MLVKHSSHMQYTSIVQALITEHFYQQFCLCKRCLFFKHCRLATFTLFTKSVHSKVLLPIIYNTTTMASMQWAYIYIVQANIYTSDRHIIIIYTCHNYYYTGYYLFPFHRDCYCSIYHLHCGGTPRVCRCGSVLLEEEKETINGFPSSYT